MLFSVRIADGNAGIQSFSVNTVQHASAVKKKKKYSAFKLTGSDHIPKTMMPRLTATGDTLPMLSAFTLPSSLAFGISSRPREHPEMLVVDIHASECEIFSESSHDRFIVIENERALRQDYFHLKFDTIRCRFTFDIMLLNLYRALFAIFLSFSTE